MNATEHLVELYFRELNYLTAADIKVVKGNNRQFDLLAFNLNNKAEYHIEVSVAHGLQWGETLEKIIEKIEYKFFGIPRNSRPDHDNTDFVKGKTYLESIKSTYAQFGFNYQNITRVWCTWRIEPSYNIENWKKVLADKFDLTPKNFDILSFRDDVIPRLLNNIGTSNYDDEILRTMSLLNVAKKQRG